MILFVGLGNPGKQYADTRHNFGFLAVDALASKLGADGWKQKFNGEWCKARLGSEDVYLLKPQTFMNLSGTSVQPAAAFWKIAPSDIVVLHDELDLPFGQLRLKQGGGHAGHNGLRSLIEKLGTPEFARIRLGIGRPPGDYPGGVVNWVLARFEGVDRAAVPDVCAKAVSACESIGSLGLREAMNRLNATAPQRPSKPPASKPPASNASASPKPAATRAPSVSDMVIGSGQTKPDGES